jgi:hypothetical protein
MSLTPRPLRGRQREYDFLFFVTFHCDVKLRVPSRISVICLCGSPLFTEQCHTPGDIIPIRK